MMNLEVTSLLIHCRVSSFEGIAKDSDVRNCPDSTRWDALDESPEALGEQQRLVSAEQCVLAAFNLTPAKYG